MRKSRICSRVGSKATVSQKAVSVIDEGKVCEADRSYGTMWSRTSVTPYPQAHIQPIDLDFLSAKLEDKKKEAIVSIGSGTSGASSAFTASFHSEHEGIQTERHRAFTQKRKLFDMGEFTICKGRKLSDDFHPLHSAENDILYTCFNERKSMDAGNFKEMEAYCREHNVKIQCGTTNN